MWQRFRAPTRGAPGSAGVLGRAGPRRRVCVVAVVLLAGVATVVVATPVGAQLGSSETLDVRIVARKLANGKVEFGFQERAIDENSAATITLPWMRFFPTTADVNRWLNSSPNWLPAGGRASEPASLVRITARKLADGRIEFGLQQRQSDRAWGARQLPRARFFPTTAEVDRWLRSSYLTLTLPQATGGEDGATASPTDTASETPTAPPSAPRFSAVSTGGKSVCVLRTDGTIECWSIPWREQIPVPKGQFSAISVGGQHSCGLRTDGTVECWGDDTVGQTRAPAGQFSAVSAGGRHSCGLRTDGTVECWGANTIRQTDAPAGQFSAVSAGGQHSCGLRTDGTVECWGDNTSGQADAPKGQFSAVSAGGQHSCGLRTDGTIKCWGSPWQGQIFPPKGQFSAVSAGYRPHTCGLRTDGTIECWGVISHVDVPAGQFSAVSAGFWMTCGMHTDGTIQCRGSSPGRA